MSGRWTNEEISKFLAVYEQYELLWNARLEDYKDKRKRETAFKELTAEIQKELGIFTVDQLRKKIKIIRTVYRKELMKVIKSKESGQFPDEIYTPKLAWFKKADSFLYDITANRQSTSNLVEDIYVEHSYTKENNNNNVSKQSLPGSSKRTPLSSKVRSCGGFKRKAEFHIDHVREAVGCLKKIAASNNAAMIKDEFTQFGKHIAVQLQQLPIMNALRLQEDIQSLITKERLSCLPPTKNDYARLVQETVASGNVSPTYSTSRPSAALSDVLPFSEYSDNCLIYDDMLIPRQSFFM